MRTDPAISGTTKAAQPRSNTASSSRCCRWPSSAASARPRNAIWTCSATRTGRCSRRSQTDQPASSAVFGRAGPVSSPATPRPSPASAASAARRPAPSPTSRRTRRSPGSVRPDRKSARHRFRAARAKNSRVAGRRERAESGVGRAHGAQIRHQVEQRRVADRHRLDIGDRQRKAGALEQRAGVAHVGEGDARAGWRRRAASASAASRLSRSSASVPAPAMAPRKSPSGLSARRIWISMPGMSFSSCSDSSDTARSMLSGSSGTWPGAATMPRLAAEEGRVGLDADGLVRLAGGEHRVAARPVSRRTAPQPSGNRRSTVASRSARSSAARAIRKSAPGDGAPRARGACARPEGSCR